jgi:hypothetical protein
MIKFVKAPEQKVDINLNEKSSKHKNNKTSDTIKINDTTEITKPDLPSNISLYRETDSNIYITFNKVIKDKRYHMKNKISSYDIQSELDNIIDNINEKYPELKIPKYIIKNPDIWNNNTTIKDIIKLVDNSKPDMPKNFSICNVNNTDYIQFCKKIGEKKHQYKTRINSHNIMQELNIFIDYLNITYNINLVKEDYNIKNTNNWKTTNNIIDHTDTKDKLSSREQSLKSINKKREQMGDVAYKEMQRIKAKDHRDKKKVEINL